MALEVGTRLGREVAIKVLPEILSHQPTVQTAIVREEEPAADPLDSQL